MLQLYKTFFLNDLAELILNCLKDQLQACHETVLCSIPFLGIKGTSKWFAVWTRK
jgi:hypothetical protein